MKFRNLSALIAVFLFVMALPAIATNGVTIDDFRRSTDKAGDPVQTTTELTITENHDWEVIKLGGGILVTPESAGTISNGEEIGSVALTAKFWFAFCSSQNYSFNSYWVSPLSGNAPPGYSANDVLAEFEIDAPTGDIPAYVVDGGTDEHEIWVDARNTETCDGNADLTVTTYSHSGTSNEVVATNDAADNYTLTVEIHDGSTVHADTWNYSNVT